MAGRLSPVKYLEMTVSTRRWVDGDVQGVVASTYDSSAREFCTPLAAWIYLAMVNPSRLPAPCERGTTRHLGTGLLCGARTGQLGQDRRRSGRDVRRHG